jgi:hypothetical protein
MWRLVDISPSIWCPLNIKVSDSPTTKSRTAPTENNKTTTQVAIAKKIFPGAKVNKKTKLIQIKKSLRMYEKFLFVVIFVQLTRKLLRIMNRYILAAIAYLALVSCETAELPTVEEPEKVSVTFVFVDIEDLSGKESSMEYVVEKLAPFTFYNKGPIEQTYTYDSKGHSLEWSKFRSDDPRAFDFAEAPSTVKIPSRISETGIVFCEGVARWSYASDEQRLSPIKGAVSTSPVPSYYKIETTATFRYKRMQAPYRLRLRGVEFGEEIEVDGMWSGLLLHDLEIAQSLDPID